MNVHKNARLTPQGRLLLVERITQQGWSVRPAAQAAGPSTNRAHHLRARYRCGGATALADRSSAPQHRKNRTSAERIARDRGSTAAAPEWPGNRPAARHPRFDGTEGSAPPGAR